jgi:uncharacterized cupredoxin-like copper-binding protein
VPKSTISLPKILLITVEAGKVEVKGAIHELELKPGAEAEWVFVALKPGKYSLRCPIPGHAEAGMTGDIAINSGQ